ncbi:hypothetical protein LTR09_010086 [Extremus antarcticus]|uniref:SAP domain-containing protein n=1 Tax=Extremus antarcticus TaxID=702011 RepID=A0AAJ0G5T5_9PEZI|nr:hypothetical protein LTR09_010086 [Extremus antarcticus]
MVDYAKKKNDELATLCKERGLAHTGKKADLVKRLEDNDASSASAPATNAAGIDDEIDWDDEPATETAKAATTQPAADALAAGGVGVEIPNPQKVPNQVVAEDPAQTDDLTVAAAPADTAAEEVKEPEKDFSAGIAERTFDEEIEKRKARARKFGMPEDTDDIKALERAKKFGTEIPGGSALGCKFGWGRVRELDDDCGSRGGGKAESEVLDELNEQRDVGHDYRWRERAAGPSSLEP